MATITLNVNDAAMPELIEALATFFGYRATLRNPANPEGPFIPNPESRQVFARRMIAEMMIGRVIDHRMRNGIPQGPRPDISTVIPQTLRAAVRKRDDLIKELLTEGVDATEISNRLEQEGLV